MTDDSDDKLLAPRRAAIHLTPPVGWLGDPNGLLHLDGTYTVGYQHNPDDDVWGPMHWRRATSTDLLTWTDHGIVLEPDELGTIFSGSVVVDRQNTSGLGSNDAGPLVAIFTHNGASGRQQQSLAYSLDNGATWTKYAANPVIASESPDLRDPKVFWYSDSGVGYWVMSVSAGDRIEFHRSTDLIRWSKTGEFSVELPDSAGVWECPDLIRFGPPSPGWNLIVSVNEIGPLGHSGVIAFAGHFDGATFTATPGFQRLDRGPDFYAVQSFSNVPAEALWVGWMSSWRYVNSHPSGGRRGIHSLPRTITRDNDGHLLQTPAIPSIARGLTCRTPVASSPTAAFEISVRDEAAIAIASEQGRAAEIQVQPDTVRLDRITQTEVISHEAFTMTRATSADVQLVVDHGTIEIFADRGRSVMTALVFAGTDWELSVEGAGSTVRVIASGDRNI